MMRGLFIIIQVKKKNYDQNLKKTQQIEIKLKQEKYGIEAVSNGSYD